MRCAFCDNIDTQVRDSRAHSNSHIIKRRRYCPSCGERFTTIEQLIRREIVVVKRDGRREMFDIEKLRRSIKLATAKGSLDDGSVDSMANTIHKQLENRVNHDVNTKTVASMVMKRMQAVDDMSFIRFAAFYSDRVTYSDFLSLIETVKEVGAPQDGPDLFTVGDVVKPKRGRKAKNS